MSVAEPYTCTGNAICVAYCPEYKRFPLTVSSINIIDGNSEHVDEEKKVVLKSISILRQIKYITEISLHTCANIYELPWCRSVFSFNNIYLLI